MPVPTGTSTRWRELDTSSRDAVVFIKYGSIPGQSSYLAEALRADGVVSSVGEGMKRADEAVLELAWCGFLESGDEVLCNVFGETKDGEYVSAPTECVVAIISLDD